MLEQLTLADFENEDGEFDIIEAPDFLKGIELERFHRKYTIRTVGDIHRDSVGDDGICRSFVGSSFYYD